jgi:hypothetical protein
MAINANAPHTHIKVSNVRRNAGVTFWSCPCFAMPGMTNTGRAPGGYSTAKSRYGTLPS